MKTDPWLNGLHLCASKAAKPLVFFKPNKDQNAERLKGPWKN